MLEVVGAYRGQVQVGVTGLRKERLVRVGDHHLATRDFQDGLPRPPHGNSVAELTVGASSWYSPREVRKISENRGRVTTREPKVPILDHGEEVGLKEALVSALVI